MELAQIKEVITAEFSGQKGVIAVLLYGSYAKGLARPDSDVDIAVLYSANEFIADPSKLALELWALKEKISHKLSVHVDLICLNNADPIIGSQIYRYHLPLVVNDSAALTEYFALLCSDYAELKELIRPMENQILERKYNV